MLTFTEQDFRQSMSVLYQMRTGTRFEALPTVLKGFNEEEYLRELKKVLHRKIKNEQQIKQLSELLEFFQEVWKSPQTIQFVEHAVKGDKNYIITHLSQVPLAAKLAAFIKSMNVEICDVLLQNGVDIDGCIGSASFNRDFGSCFGELYNALYVACEQQNADKVAWLIQKGANLRFGDLIKSPAKVSIETDSTDCLKLLLKTGQFDKEFQNFLNLAAKNGKFQVTNLLINRFKVKWTQKTWQLSIESRNQDLVNFFLAQGAAMNKNLLFKVAEKTDGKTLQILLEHSKVDVNIKNSKGQTLLFIAAKLFDKGMCAVLLQMGADITKTDKAGKDIFRYIEDAPIGEEYKNSFITFLKEYTNGTKE